MDALSNPSFDKGARLRVNPRFYGAKRSLGLAGGPGGTAG